MSFEWDEKKRRVNIIKHGIDFFDVKELFDSDTVTIPDERIDYGENRFIVIGILKYMVVVVVYTEFYYFQQISN